MEISVKRLMDSNQYLTEVEKIRKETNSTQVPILFNHAYYAPISSTPYYDRIFGIDRNEFKKDDAEREMLKALKKEVPKARTHKFQTYAHMAF